MDPRPDQLAVTLSDHGRPHAPSNVFPGSLYAHVTVAPHEHLAYPHPTRPYAFHTSCIKCMIGALVLHVGRLRRARAVPPRPPVQRPLLAPHADRRRNVLVRCQVVAADPVDRVPVVVAPEPAQVPLHAGLRVHGRHLLRRRRDARVPHEPRRRVVRLIAVVLGGVSLAAGRGARLDLRRRFRLLDGRCDFRLGCCRLRRLLSLRRGRGRVLE